MPAEQLLLTPTQARRHAEADEVNRLIALLRGSGWVSAKTIRALAGWDDRAVRRIAAASDGAVISGDAGYKLLAESTPEDFKEFSGRLQSQIRRMAARMIRVRRRWQEYGRPL